MTLITTSFFKVSLLFLVCSMTAHGQTRIGLTFNLGDRQQVSRHSEAFASALGPSGSISLSKVVDVGERRMSLQYGIACGVVPYNLKVIGIDSVTIPNDIFPFPDYSTLFASFDLMLTPKFLVYNKYLLIGAGVGITGYASLVPNNQYGIHVANPDNSLTTVFEASMSAPANRFSPFWKMAAFYDVSRSFSIGIEYVNHTRPAAQGTFEFYHTKTPVYGGIEIYQREVRVGVFYRLKRRV